MNTITIAKDGNIRIKSTFLINKDLVDELREITLSKGQFKSFLYFVEDIYLLEEKNNKDKIFKMIFYSTPIKQDTKYGEQEIKEEAIHKAASILEESAKLFLNRINYFSSLRKINVASKGIFNLREEK